MIHAWLTSTLYENVWTKFGESKLDSYRKMSERQYLWLTFSDFCCRRDQISVLTYNMFMFKRVLFYKTILILIFHEPDLIGFDLLCLMPLSAISWRPVLVVEETGVPGENHRPWVSNW